MRLNRILYNVKLKQVDPGPFKNQLKYELMNELYRHRSHSWVPVFTTSMLTLFAVLATVMIIKPETAFKAHQMAFKSDKQLDYLLMNNEKTNNDNYQSQLQPVVSNGSSAFSMMEDDKSYIIHKIKDDSDRTIILISEVKKKVQPKILY